MIGARIAWLGLARLGDAAQQAVAARGELVGEGVLLVCGLNQRSPVSRVLRLPTPARMSAAVRRTFARSFSTSLSSARSRSAETSPVMVCPFPDAAGALGCRDGVHLTHLVRPASANLSVGVL